MERFRCSHCSKTTSFYTIPGLEFHRGADVVKVWSATAEDADTGLIGEVLSIEHDLVVRCGVGALRITELQRPGKLEAQHRQPYRDCTSKR